MLGAQFYFLTSKVKVMIKSELIKKLNEIEGDFEVCIFDWRKNLYHADTEPQSNGIHSKFTVELEKEDVSEQFISLGFENNDYNKDGTLNQ